MNQLFVQELQENFYATIQYPNKTELVEQLGLTGKPLQEVKGMTIAAFRIAQNTSELSNQYMDAKLLRFLCSKRAIEYWIEKQWLVANKNNQNQLKLSRKGIEKCSEDLDKSTSEEKVMEWTTRMLKGDDVATEKMSNLNFKRSEGDEHDIMLYQDIVDLISINETEVESLVKARVGQGKFKDNVKSLWDMERCFVTLVDIPSMLIASHIKPWSECDNSSERLDGANGLLLCAHIDKLFDRHLITFKEKGRNFELVISETLFEHKEALKSLGIETGLELPLDRMWNNVAAIERFKKYMAIHNRLFDELSIN